MAQEVAVEAIENYGLNKSLKNKSANSISNIGIIGCGSVGQNIARMSSSFGFDVVFIEVSEKEIERALEELSKELDRQIDRWGMTSGEKRAILSRIKGSTDWSELTNCDVVIEAIKSKNRDLKIELRREIYRTVEKHVRPDTVLATNVSTLIITELANGLKHPERVVGMHFLSPAPDTPVVEVVRSLMTSDEAYEKTVKFAKLLKKRIIPAAESPGLISTRLIVPFINEACEVLMEGISNIADIDATMQMGFGLALGPFEMADKIGIDKVVFWMDNLYQEFGDQKYKASPLLRQKLRANQTGRRARQGFYKYDADGNKI